MKKSQKIPKNFECVICEYKTLSKKDFEKHLLTPKHLDTTNTTKKSQKIPKIFECDCGKKYPYRSSLFNHKKKCTYEGQNQIIEKSEKNMDYKGMFLTMIKENKQLHNTLVTQQNQINELIPKIGNQIVGNNIINKNKFNINIFLNEQITPLIVIGCFMVLIGIFVANTATKSTS